MKPFGPVQLQLTDVGVVNAVNVSALPLHKGALDDAVGVAGV